MTTKAGSIPLATMDVPKGWRVTTEVVLTEEIQRPPKAPHHAGLEKERRPARVTVARETVDPQWFKIDRALNNFLGELADGVAGFEVLEQGPFAFDDGVQGSAARVRYDPATGLTVVQHHVFRIDGSVVTRFTVSADAQRTEQLNDLDDLLRSFHPLTDKS